MILPEHLEIVEDSDGKRILSLNRGETYFVKIRNKNTGEVKNILLPEIPHGMTHKEIAEAFNQTLERALKSDIFKGRPESNS